MPMLTIGQEQFHYRFDGPENAPVLMASNSLGTDLAMWDTQIPLWSQEFRVLRYDSRGHGKSTAPDRPYSMDELGRDAIAVMDALGLKQVNWCGVSKGGMVGQWLATHAPERLRRAVFANTAAQMGPPDLWNARIRLARSEGMAPIANAMADRWFTKRFQAADPVEVNRVTSLVSQQPQHGYAGCCAAIRDMDQREAIRAITIPVLVIIGAQDPATPPAAGELIHANIKGSKKFVLDAAHLSNVEHPKAFANTVLDFIR